MWFPRSANKIFQYEYTPVLYESFPCTTFCVYELNDGDDDIDNDNDDCNDDLNQLGWKVLISSYRTTPVDDGCMQSDLNLTIQSNLIILLTAYDLL